MLLWLAMTALAADPPTGMVHIPGGTYSPLYAPSPEQREVMVGPFWLDEAPVTQGEFAQFVSEHERWRRGHIKPLFADSRYLSSWVDESTPTGGLDLPVVEVSWFAARAYCRAQGKRLPTEDEWEIAASASRDKPFARGEPEWTEQILKWYSLPASHTHPVRERPPNYFGVYDMHGLVWEWVEDFNNTLYGADNREGGDEERLRFCGAGALSAEDAGDYANFMRVAFRTSLQATYTTRSLGFRCAQDVEAP